MTSRNLSQTSERLQLSETRKISREIVIRGMYLEACHLPYAGINSNAKKTLW